MKEIVSTTLPSGGMLIGMRRSLKRKQRRLQNPKVMDGQKTHRVLSLEYVFSHGIEDFKCPWEIPSEYLLKPMVKDF
jgi:hypothetical protein